MDKEMDLNHCIRSGTPGTLVSPFVSVPLAICYGNVPEQTKAAVKR